jgi:hypothetical protein
MPGNPGIFHLLNFLFSLPYRNFPHPKPSNIFLGNLALIFGKLPELISFYFFEPKNNRQGH